MTALPVRFVGSPEPDAVGRRPPDRSSTATLALSGPMGKSVYLRFWQSASCAGGEEVVSRAGAGLRSVQSAGPPAGMRERCLRNGRGTRRLPRPLQMGGAVRSGVDDDGGAVVDQRPDLVHLPIGH